MNKTLIFLILALGLTGGIIYYSISESSEYATFGKAVTNPGKEYHIVGTLRRDLRMSYDPILNANLFTFYLQDNNGQTLQVLYNGSKPQDFENSEQVVVVGSYQDSVFYAKQILLKCPSKYNDGVKVEVAKNPT